MLAFILPLVCAQLPAAQPTTPDPTIMQPSTATDPVLVTVEGGVGLGASVTGVRFEADGVVAAEESTRPTTFVLAGIEWPFSSNLSFGMRTGLYSVADPFSATGGDRSLIDAAARARISFDLWHPVSMDLMLDAGPGWWSSDGQDTLLGWTRRVAVGASYRVRDDLALLANLGWFQGNALPTDDGLGSATLRKTQGVNFDAVTLSVGVRGGR